MALLVGAIDALSGGLHRYFFMRELSGGISIENGQNIARNNCLQVSKLPKLEVTDSMKM